MKTMLNRVNSMMSLAWCVIRQAKSKLSAIAMHIVAMNLPTLDLSNSYFGRLLPFSDPRSRDTFPPLYINPIQERIMIINEQIVSVDSALCVIFLPYRCSWKESLMSSDDDVSWTSCPPVNI